MNLISRTITGMALVLFGVILMIVSIFSSFVFLVYGIIILAIGIVIFFNKSEDKIEQRKDLKVERRKK